MSYNYFRFRKRNGRHTEILLPVSILTCQSLSYLILGRRTKFHVNRTIGGDNRRRSYDVIKILTMAAVDVANQLPVPVWYCACPQKVIIYSCTKFFKDISIHGWGITTSGFGKWTVAILKFYFRFRLWPISRHRHLILRRHTKFRMNRTVGDLTLCQFSRWRRSAMLYFI